MTAISRLLPLLLRPLSPFSETAKQKVRLHRVTEDFRLKNRTPSEEAPLQRRYGKLSDTDKNKIRTKFGEKPQSLASKTSSRATPKQTAYPFNPLEENLALIIQNNTLITQNNILIRKNTPFPSLERTHNSEKENTLRNLENENIDLTISNSAKKWQMLQEHTQSSAQKSTQTPTAKKPVQVLTPVNHLSPISTPSTSTSNTPLELSPEGSPTIQRSTPPSTSATFRPLASPPTTVDNRSEQSTDHNSPPLSDTKVKSKRQTSALLEQTAARVKRLLESNAPRRPDPESSDSESDTSLSPTPEKANPQTQLALPDGTQFSLSLSPDTDTILATVIIGKTKVDIPLSNTTEKSTTLYNALMQKTTEIREKIKEEKAEKHLSLLTKKVYEQLTDQALRLAAKKRTKEQTETMEEGTVYRDTRLCYHIKIQNRDIPLGKKEAITAEAIKAKLHTALRS